MTSPVGANAIDSSADAGLELGQAGLDLLGGGDDLLGPRGALGLEVGLGRAELGVQLVLAPVDVGAQLVLELGQALAGLAAATLGLLLDRLRGRACARPRRRG